ncbi:hypothetical protein ACIPYQ_22725 [Streptomyces sp. NPDC090045]|uniref:hypothetical protein n=1 Tax=Streptomyces sp. NPDC090045 TaxID=3365927 RepID=UPI0038088AE9
MTTPSARAASSRQSPFAGLDVCQVARLELSPGAHGPRFDDDLWDLTGLALAPKSMGSYHLRWDFARIVNPTWRLVAKEMITALLAPHDERVALLPHAFRTPKSVGSMYDMIRHLANWLNWLTTEGVTTLATVDQDHCDRYLALASRRLRGDGTVKPTTLVGRITPVQNLALYGELYTQDAYAPGFLPWGGRATSEIAGCQPRDGNLVGPVPDHVFQPMMAAALWMVETLGPHVAEEIEREQARAVPISGIPYKQALTDRQKRRFQAHIRACVRDGVPLPRLADRDITQRVMSGGWSSSDPLLEVHTDQLLRDGAGNRSMHPHNLEILRPLMEDAVAKVGVVAVNGRDAAAIQRADDTGLVPWTLPLDHWALHRLASIVQGACMVVTAAVSGMRASELAELTEDSCLPPTSAYSGAMRYRLASQLIKSQELGGVPEEWVVVEEAWRAVGLAARIARRSGALHGAVFGMKTLATADVYTRFRDWVNGPEGIRLGLAQIPDGPVNARKLRRTLAFALAYRPGGLIAAKIHLKHVHVATTEGYAHRPGGAQGYFLAEVGEEEANHHLELTAAAFREFQAGNMPSGPGARDVIASFRQVDNALGGHQAGEPKVMGSDRQLVNLLRDQAQYLHVGAANYCWFKDPAKALCLKIAGAPVTADSQPMAGMCDSARCPQATHHPCHRPVWAENAERAKTFLGTIPRGHTAARERVRADLARTVRVLDEIDAAAGTGPDRGQ